MILCVATWTVLSGQETFEGQEIRHCRTFLNVTCTVRLLFQNKRNLMKNKNYIPETHLYLHSSSTVHFDNGKPALKCFGLV